MFPTLKYLRSKNIVREMETINPSLRLLKIIEKRKRRARKRMIKKPGTAKKE